MAIVIVGIQNPRIEAIMVPIKILKLGIVRLNVHLSKIIKNAIIATDGTT